MMADVVVNRHLLTQTDLDSGALTVHGAVIHQFRELGRYLGRVVRGDRTEGTFHLVVDEEVRATQVHIDLSSIRGGSVISEHHPLPCGCRGTFEAEGPHFELSPGGYGVFYVSQGPGGFSVRVGRPDERAEEAFDSAELGEDDMFAATMIRPGRYALSNVGTKARGEVVVSLPERGRVPFRPPDAVTVTCSTDTFRPKRVVVRSGQGQVYRFKTRSRIRIELTKPDDAEVAPAKRPAERRRRR
jgi:hypothetical protein